jgi:holo-[acyl-carrier protein] synthase
VKEAAYKAMYPYARATWKELSYTGLTATSKPRVEYLPSAPSPDREENKIGRLHVSVSHDGEYVYASVLAESTS